jgi:hypothetical protein
MTMDDINKMGRGANKHATSLKSQTTESKLYSTPKIKIDDVWVSLKLRDTVGFGAKDMETKNILKDTFLEVVGDVGEKIRGCILVHKCERLREGGFKDLEQIKQLFETMGLKFDEHLLLVVTHTGHLSEETKQKYSDELREGPLPEIPIERIMHVNFANPDELNEHHKKWYIDTTAEEYRRLMNKLMEFEDEISPVAKDIKGFFDNAYTKDLKKKGTLSSFVTELADVGGRAAKSLRLSVP